MQAFILHWRRFGLECRLRSVSRIVFVVGGSTAGFWRLGPDNARKKIWRSKQPRLDGCFCPRIGSRKPPIWLNHGQGGCS